MREIRLGLEHNVAVSWYAIPTLSAAQMNEIRTGLEHGVDVSDITRAYMDGSEVKELNVTGNDETVSEYKEEQQEQIRLGELSGVDVSLYSNPMYTADEM